MQEIDIASIKEKAVKGIIALTGRTFLIQCIAFGATFLLTVFLSPAVFGIFYIVSACISFLSYFSDIGLAAALIQKKETLTESDLRTTFTIQQTLVLILCLIMFVLSPSLGSLYQLDQTGIWLLRSLIVSFFLSSLKTIPSVLLERKLDFNKLVIPQIAETVGFYGLAVILAYAGFGVTSFTYAVLFRACIGLIVIYQIAPWKIGLEISIPVAKKLLKFGIPFQMNSLLALVKDDALTLVLGYLLSLEEIGYIGWAKKWAEIPLRLIMDNVIRVTFPTFSRLQHDLKHLGASVEKTLFGLSITIVPLSIALLFFIEPLISIIPKYQKWQPAVLPFYLFVFSSLIASYSTPLTNALNAVGKIFITLLLMIFWTLLTWLLILILLPSIGFLCVPVTQVILASSLVLVVFLVKRICSFSFLQSVWVSLVGGIIQAVVYSIGLHSIKSPTIPYLIIMGITGGILYMSTVWMFEKKRILSVWSLFRQKSL